MQRPKLFNRATVKLTLVYTAILMLLSLFFSGVIGYTTSRVVTKPSWHGDIVVSQSFRDGEVRRYLVEQERELNGRIVAALILVNLVVLVFGAGFSLLLARWTLRPIERAMDDETRFVADASHELRTPLAVIITENEVTLRDKKVSHKELEHQVESNLAEARKLQNLANYLLEINNSDAAVQMTEGDLTEIIKSAMSQVKKQAATRNIDFTRDVTPV
jgi:signal transduction histidine kinase